jgi:hypothetical protein
LFPPEAASERLRLFPLKAGPGRRAAAVLAVEPPVLLTPLKFGEPERPILFPPRTASGRRAAVEPAAELPAPLFPPEAASERLRLFPLKAWPGWKAAAVLAVEPPVLLTLLKFGEPERPILFPPWTASGRRAAVEPAAELPAPLFPPKTASERLRLFPLKAGPGRRIGPEKGRVGAATPVSELVEVFLKPAASR